MNTQTKPPAVASATPGPWIATKNNSVYGANQPKNGQAYRKLIRPAIQTEAEAARYGGTLAEQAANAHLIAAAPDLLTALEDGRDALMQCVARYPELANMVLSANLHMQAALNQAQS